MSEKNLKRQAYIGVFWSGVEKFSTQIIVFVSGIILIRLLTPEDYGLLAMVIVFNALSITFIDSGFGIALIQRKNITHLHESAVFYFNIILGALLCVSLFFMASFIAEFYKEPQLTPIVKVLGLNIFILSFGIVQSNILIRKLDFKTSTKTSFLSVGISAIIAILMAYYGFGVWALVIQLIAVSFIRVVSLWMLTNWRPLKRLSISALKDLFGFGNNVLIASLVSTVGENVYNVFIGRYYNTSQLGIYERGKKIPIMFTHMITTSVSRVSYSVFSKLQNERKRLSNAFAKNLEFLSSITIPIFLLFMIMAKSFVIIVIKEKWLPAVPYFQLFAFYAMIFPWITLNGQLIYSVGKPNVNTRLTILRQSVRLLVLIVTLKYGVLWIVIGEIFVNLIYLIISSVYVGKQIPFGLYRQVKLVSPYILMSLFVGALVYFIQFMLIKNLYILVSLQLLIGFGVYFLLNMLFKTNSYLEFQKILKVFIPLLKKKLLKK